MDWTSVLNAARARALDTAATARPGERGDLAKGGNGREGRDDAAGMGWDFRRARIA